jgi:hypothetical protein
VLVDKGKAEIIKGDDDSPIVGGFKTYIRPLIIRLLKYIKHQTRAFRANRNRIYKRDGYECVYCGSNLVTSCFKCNLKKSNRTPEEANMLMKHKPFAPNLVHENGLQKIWTDYQKSFVY